MAVDILMPNLGFDTQTARLVAWLKQPGDAIAKGEPIAVIESDKADVELEAIASGVLLAQLAQAEQDVDVGSVIGRIGSAEEYRAGESEAVGSRGSADREAESEQPPRVSPLARRIAQDLQVDINHVAGSGSRGRVTRQDVEAYHRTGSGSRPGGVAVNGADARGVKALPVVRRAARERGILLDDVLAAGFENPLTLAALDAYTSRIGERSAAHEVTTPPEARAVSISGATALPISRARQAIGRRLSESMREAPHFYVTGEFDFEQALLRLSSLGDKAKVNDLLLYLTTQTLVRVPALNRTFEEGTLYQHDAVNLAVAVAREDGLITPVIRDAGRYSLTGLAAESRALIERTRSNRLAADDLRGGTFTVSNMGMIAQVDHFTAVINPPQVGILAIGALKQRPFAQDGGLFLRRTAHLTLSGDHRAVDGMDLARFMAVFQDELDRFAA